MQVRIAEGLVSVIVPVFNRPAMLIRAVECVEAQTYRPLELILVDDGSTDGTSALCDENARQRQVVVKVVHRANGGPGAARESGRQVAEGEFIQYLDSDDWIDPRKLEVQVEALRRELGTDIAYCGTTETDDDCPGATAIRGRTDEAFSSIFPAFLSGRLWHTITPLYRRDFSDKLGAWSELRQEEDLEYDARAGALGARLVHCPEVLAVHRHHAGPRAGGDSLRDRDRMRWRCESHRRVFAHARAAGVDHRDENMQRYARELFLLARQCGALDLAGESNAIFRLAREASGPGRRRGAEFAAYRVLAWVLGWGRAGRFGQWLDSVRSSREGRAE